MSRYLIVAHQTGFSPELRRELAALVAKDSVAEFAVLVPELDSPNFTWEGETVDIANQRAADIGTVLRETIGARVVRTTAGVSDPLRAISDELGTDPPYDTLVICTLPPGASRWLHLDLVHQAERKFGLPVVHVIARSPH